MVKYKCRCSKLAELLSSCGKVTNKLEWSKLDTWNSTHIRLAIEIYNKTNGIFVSPEIKTLDMSAGNELEEEGVILYDKHFGTNYHFGYSASRDVLNSFEKSNEFITGTRDFGSDTKTIDQKTSTDKNVFDAKKFGEVETDYTIAMNGYKWLYNTPELELYNVLIPATFGQVKKIVDNKAFIEMLSDSERDKFQEEVEKNYAFENLELSKRIDTKPVPIIENFEEIISYRVKVMNKWIEDNKHKF